MGDDTWMNLYKDLIDPSMCFPYDSFNVEDLHSVDNGVIEHLFPLMQKSAGDWDLLVGHFLGVDHVGHRVGPGHEAMREKLQQMDGVLRRVVERLDDETLLVVLGDHGMDPKGDHGGDGILETASATWIYSKTRPLKLLPIDTVPQALMINTTFPNSPSSHRSIQQIDLVPSLSLLLGIPIPFNNLGTVIPELFLRGDDLRTALQLNSRQIKSYLDAYRASPSGGELDASWNDITGLYRKAIVSKTGAVEANHEFARAVLEVCRRMWAQFSMTLMVQGIMVIMLTIPATSLSVHRLDREPFGWQERTLEAVALSGLGFLGGGVIGLVLHTSFSIFIEMPMNPSHLALFGSSFTATVALIHQTLPLSSWTSVLSPSGSMVLLQSILLFSNSFIFWEERVLPFLTMSSLVPTLHPLLYSPNKTLRNRAIKFGAIFIICVRLVSIITVCREEQGSYCHVTFYASSVLPSPPLAVLVTIIPVAILLPTLARRFMRIAAADHGLAPITVEWYLRAALLGGTGFWFLDWLESSKVSFGPIGSLDSGTIRLVRTTVASVVAWSSGVALALWSASPPNLSIIKQRNEAGHLTVQVLGFANAFGSFYLSFLLIIFSSIWLTAQLSGQIALALSLTAFLAYAEFLDLTRDIKYADQPKEYRNLTLAEITPLALLSLQVYYATGHQATLSSLQWKSAFIFSSDRGTLSPLTVALNTIGPVVFFTLCIPLLSLWNVEPFNKSSPLAVQSKRVVAGVLKSVLVTSNYFATLLLFSATSSMLLRRHLMVWKVFAPRYMLAGLCVLAVDLAGVVGVAGGISTVIHTVSAPFKSMIQ
jgi:phosphatidylinositol glycan class O